MTSGSEADRPPRPSSETAEGAAQQGPQRSKRGAVITVRVSDDERQRIDEGAHLFSVSRSVFLRAAAIDAVDAVRTASAIADATGAELQAPAPSAPSALVATAQAPQALSDLPQVRELVALRTAVNKIGVNINQIARLMNSSDQVVVGRDLDTNDFVNDFVGIIGSAVEVLTEVKEALSQPTGTVELNDLTATPGVHEMTTPWDRLAPT